MRRRLYSELRTIYETTLSDPHTFRLTLKFKDTIDGGLLRQAVDMTMRRYPYFCVRLCADEREIYLEDNPAPLPVLQGNERLVLGSEQTAGHLIAFSWRKDRLNLDAYHALTDGGGIAPMIKTLLHTYCSLFYGEELSAEGIRLPDSEILPAEWDDPAAEPLPAGKTGLVSKWSGPALQLAEEGKVRLIPDAEVHSLRIPEQAFMRFNLSNDGSPATIAALLLARSIAEVCPGAARTPVIGMCVNQRPALRAPLAHQSLVGDVRLPFTQRLKAMPFSRQATCFRGMVALQSDPDMVLDEIRDYRSLMAHLASLGTHAERQACCVRRMEELSRCLTANVSYVGKASLGTAEQYLLEYETVPSTALPSTHVPLTIEMSAVNGWFFVNMIQYFRETEIFEAFLAQLDENDIEYHVLTSVEAKYPRIELPIPQPE